MRWVVNYIRQVFCKHDFLTEDVYVSTDYGVSGTKVYMRCKNCGYNTNHWKHI